VLDKILRINFHYERLQTLTFEDIDGEKRHTFWYLEYDKSVSVYPPIGITRYEARGAEIGYYATVDGTHVWWDGVLPGGKRWRGAVKEVIGTETLTLLKEYGSFI